MEFYTLGRVIDRWSTRTVSAFDEWAGLAAVPLPTGDDDTDALQRYYLRVAVLDPWTERARPWTVGILSEAQWQRYPIGSWLRLRVSGWAPLLRWLRYIRIEETLPAGPGSSPCATS